MISLIKPDKPKQTVPPEPLYFDAGEDNVEIPRLELLNEITIALEEFGFRDQDRFHNFRYFLFRHLCFARQFFVSRKHVGLIVGPTGCGKTTSIESICQRLSVPYSIIDVSRCVTEGIKGTSVTNLLSDYYFQVKKSKEEWHQPRILVLDEIHTLVLRDSHRGGQILRQFLALLAGEPMNSTRDYDNGQEHVETILTDQLSIIIVASFDGSLTRTDSSNPGGELENKTSQEILALIESQGIPGEFLGRLTLPPVILPGPTKKELEQCLRSPDQRNPLPELLASVVPRKVTLSSETVENLLIEAADRNLGYRGLRQLCEEFVARNLVELLNGATHI